MDDADEIVTKMLALEREGRAAGAGFYQYEESKKSLWSQLSQEFNPGGISIPLQDVKDRLLYRMSLEAVKCLDETVLRSVGDANIGSVMGIGFPQWTGGALQFINSVGIEAFTNRATELASRYGERFLPSDTLYKMAERGEQF
jgi:3-hydroxyacyl-CoA dehydrogenase/enoyl-CoA hydratase/3-hydroxybutyryl-CoA epimerase